MDPRLAVVARRESMSFERHQPNQLRSATWTTYAITSSIAMGSVAVRTQRGVATERRGRWRSPARKFAGVSAECGPLVRLAPGQPAGALVHYHGERLRASGQSRMLGAVDSTSVGPGGELGGELGETDSDA